MKKLEYNFSKLLDFEPSKAEQRGVGGGWWPSETAQLWGMRIVVWSVSLNGRRLLGRERERLCHARDPGQKWFTQQGGKPGSFSLDLSRVELGQRNLALRVLFGVREGWGWGWGEGGVLYVEAGEEGDWLAGYWAGLCEAKPVMSGAGLLLQARHYHLY